jgi:acyl carrier protein
MDPMDLDQFVARLRGDFALEIPEGMGAHDDLYDIPGFSSLDAYEVLLAAEELAGADAPPLDAPPIRSLADAFGYYELLCAPAPTTS